MAHVFSGLTHADAEVTSLGLDAAHLGKRRGRAMHTFIE